MIEEHNENVEVYDEDIGDYFEAHGKNNKQGIFLKKFI